ncbi:MAG: VOC family protein [Deltaproteobacteria bacterium]|nr:VOC family protein [Deltaproteobacteria bacterium]
MWPLLPRVDQICIAVWDAEKKAKQLHRDFGAGPWIFRMIEAPPFIDMTVKGKRQNWKTKAAIAEMKGCMLELMEPMDEVSIFYEFLKEKGEGMHHVGVLVPNIDAAVKEAEKRGIEILSSARWPNNAGGLAYLDTWNTHGMIIELLERPAPEHRTPPIKRWPE